MYPLSQVAVASQYECSGTFDGTPKPAQALSLREAAKEEQEVEDDAAAKWHEQEQPDYIRKRL